MSVKRLAVLLFAIIISCQLWQFGEYALDIGRINGGLTSLEAFIPTPLTLIRTMDENLGLLSTELSYTLLRGIFGLLIGALISLIITVIGIFVPDARRVVMPLTISLNSFPMVGFAPLIILLFGQGSAFGIVAISTLISYFPCFVILDKAIREVNEDFLNLARIWGASRWSVFVHIQLPYLLPYLFTAVKLALPASIVGATLGEWLGTKHGIGQLITVSLYQLKPGMLYSALIMLVVGVALLVGMLNVLERAALPWKHRTEILG